MARARSWMVISTSPTSIRAVTGGPAAASARASVARRTSAFWRTSS